MASLEENMKTVVLKGMEALGKGAAGLASKAQEKLHGMNLEARCSELRREIANVAMELSKEGAELPEKLDVLVKELNELEARRSAEKSAQPEAAAAETDTAEPAPDASEAAETKTAEPNPCDAVKDGLEQIAAHAGKVVGAAMDAVGSLVGSAVEMFKNAAEGDPHDEAEDAEADGTVVSEQEPEQDNDAPADEPEAAPAEETPAQDSAAEETND